MLGPVFRTYEPTRDRLVAVKVFRLDLTPEQAQALADELRQVVDLDLDHPSIVRPVAAGVEGTSAYYATEYVAAESLDIALRHYAPAPMEKVLPFITQLAGAIDFARTGGVGHGALHPRDVFVTPEEARATGFGVVQALERLGVRAPTRRPYTAPERVGGTPGDVWDVRADVYSLAAITFELITGRRPVGSEVGDLGATAGPHADHVASAVARGLSEEPDRRYESALAFAAALEAASRGERTTGAVEQVRAVTGAALTQPADPSSTEVEEEEPAFRVERELEFDREALSEPLDARELDTDSAEDPEVEREDDLAEIQLRDEEALFREAEDARPRQVDDDGIHLAFEPDVAEDERGADPSMLDFDAVPEREPAPEPERFALEPNRVSTREEALAGDYPPDDRGARRPVLVPVALTLLLGLFVGFLAGYLVGSRNDVSPVDEATRGAAEAPTGEVTRSTEASGESPSRAPAGQSRPQSPPPAASQPPRAEAPAQAAAPAAAAPARSRLVVRSTPTGAQVYVDGRRRGTTPFTLVPLAPGTYTIRVSRSGYEQQTQRVAVPAGGTRDLTFRLERTPARAPARTPAAPQTFTGSIYVDSRPRGATVLLNGREVGSTPLQLGDVRAGSHVVRLELPGHRTWTTSTQVVAGQVARVTGSLERQP